MKKATTKRERKYGKKITDLKEDVAVDIKVMVDYAHVMKFKSIEQAQKFIDKKNKEADKANRPRASFIFI